MLLPYVTLKYSPVPSCFVVRVLDRHLSTPKVEEEFSDIEQGNVHEVGSKAYGDAHHSGWGKSTKDAWFADASPPAVCCVLSHGPRGNDESNVLDVVTRSSHRHLTKWIVVMVTTFKYEVMRLEMDSVIRVLFRKLGPFHRAIDPT